MTLEPYRRVLTLPVFSVIRQSMAALVPESQRRPGYALDSMSVELSFMAGPALAVLLVMAASARTAMYCVGAGVVLAGIALFVLNPPVRGAEETQVNAAPVRRRDWLNSRLGALLVAGTAIGGPLTGFVIDATAPAWGFVVAGLAGAVLALVAVPWYRDQTPITSMLDYGVTWPKPCAPPPPGVSTV